MEATPATDRKGRPTVWAYGYGGGGGRPRLRGGRVYYEVRPRTPGPAYRVTVQDVISNLNGPP